MAGERLFYSVDGKVVTGPVTGAELAQLREAGVVTGTTLVCPAGGTAWQALETIDLVVVPVVKAKAMEPEAKTAEAEVKPGVTGPIFYPELVALGLGVVLICFLLLGSLAKEVGASLLHPTPVEDPADTLVRLDQRLHGTDAEGTLVSRFRDDFQELNDEEDRLVKAVFSGPKPPPLPWTEMADVMAYKTVIAGSRVQVTEVIAFLKEERAKREAMLGQKGLSPEEVTLVLTQLHEDTRIESMLHFWNGMLLHCDDSLERANFLETHWGHCTPGAGEAVVCDTPGLQQEYDAMAAKWTAHQKQSIAEMKAMYDLALRGL